MRVRNHELVWIASPERSSPSLLFLFFFFPRPISYISTCSGGLSKFPGGGILGAEKSRPPPPGFWIISDSGLSGQAEKTSPSPGVWINISNSGLHISMLRERRKLTFFHRGDIPTDFHPGGMSSQFNSRGGGDVASILEGGGRSSPKSPLSRDCISSYPLHSPILNPFSLLSSFSFFSLSYNLCPK